MKIAHIVSTYPPYRGGMGNVCYHQVKGLAALGHEITVFTPFYKNQRLQVEDPEESRRRAIPSVKVIYLKPFFKFGNAAVIPQIGGLLKDFDLIYLHWPFIGGAESILWQSKKLPSLVVQYHMDLNGQGWRDLFFKFYQSIFLPLMVKQAKKIVVSSLDYALTSALKKFLPKYREKFIELPLGVDLEKFFPQEPDQELKNKLGLKQENKIVLFVAGLDKAHYFKGLGVLLSAMSKISSSLSGSTELTVEVLRAEGLRSPDEGPKVEKNIKLIIGGEGDLKEKYQKMAVDLKIKDKVIFVGNISNDQLIKFYNLTDIFVLSSISRSEAFGLVLLEAMACGKPIIVSNLPGPRTLVKEGENGFKVKSGDADDLAKKIGLILKDRQLIKKMGENALKLVREKYNWKEIVQKLEKIYDENLD